MVVTLNDKKHKIVYLINSLNTGGTETMLYRLLKDIDRLTFDPTVVLLFSNGGPLQKKIEDLNITIFSVNLHNRYNVFSIIKLYRLLNRLSPSILHTQLFASDILGRVIGKILGIPIIISSIQSIHYDSKLKDLLIKVTEGFSYKTTIVSHIAGNRFVKDNILSWDKLRVIHNGLDPKCFFFGLSDQEKANFRAKFSLSGEQFVLLSVGNLRIQKGYNYLLEALVLLKNYHNNFKLIIAGEGVLEHDLKSMVDDLKLNKQVVFLGRVDDVPVLMAASDALVLSSLREGLPGVVMEAMASGLPVIATAVGGTQELVEDGKTGYLVPSKSPKEMADALKRLMLLPAKKRSAMGDAGRSKVLEQFHIDKMVKAYESLYIECLKDKHII